MRIILDRFRLANRVEVKTVNALLIWSVYMPVFLKICILLVSSLGSIAFSHTTYLLPGECVNIRNNLICARSTKLYSEVKVVSTIFNCALKKVNNGHKMWVLEQFLTLNDGSTKKTVIAKYAHFDQTKCLEKHESLKLKN